MEVACENSANLEQETKTTKIVTYPLLSQASSIEGKALQALCFKIHLLATFNCKMFTTKNSVAKNKKPEVEDTL